MKALEKDRTRRYQTANALANDVRRHLNDEPVAAGPPSVRYKARKFVRRHRFGVAVAGALIALLATFAGVMTVQANRISAERDRANQEAATAIQVTEFLTNLFNVSDPSEARGNALTARDVLDKGVGQLALGLQDQPTLRSRLQAIIGVVYTNLALYAAADPLLTQAATTDEQLLGPDHPQTLNAQHQLANLRWQQGDLAGAETLYKRVVESRARLLGEDHPDTLKTNFDLASTYIKGKKWDLAEPLAKRTLELQRQRLGRSHPDTLLSMNNLESMYTSQRRYSDAEPIARDVLQLMQQALGTDHPDTLRATANLALILHNTGRANEAERLYLEALRIRRRVLGPRHPDTLNNLGNLAALYSVNLRLPEAERFALEAYGGLVAVFGPDHPDTIRMIRGLARIYERWQRPDKSKEWLAKLPSESPRP